MDDVNHRTTACAGTEGVAQENRVDGLEVFKRLRRIFLIDDFNEITESIIAKPILGSGLLQHSHHFIAMPVPELVPFPYPAGLFFSGAYKRGRVGITGDCSSSMQAVNHLSQLLSLPQGLVPGLSLGHHIHIRRIADASQRLQVRKNFFLFIGHVVDVVHIRIKRCAQTEITEDECQNEEKPQQPAVPVGRYR